MHRKFNWSVAGLIFKALCLMICIISLYLVIDAGSDATGIIRSYLGIENNSKSDFSKSMQFLRTYTQATGDLTLALNTGMSQEEAEEFYEEIKQPEVETPESPDSNNGSPTPWDSSDPDAAITTHCNSWGYPRTVGNSNTWQIVNHSSGTYIWQTQGSLWTEIGSGSSSLKSAGCMYFCISAAICNTKGVVFGVEDMLKELGYTVSFQSNPPKFKTAEQMSYVGNHPGYKHPDGTDASLLALLDKFGLQHSDDGEIIDESKLSSGMYLCHVKDETANRLSSSSSNEHWFLIVGADGQDYELANINLQKIKCDKGYVNGLNGTSKMNHCVYISR